jgi:hypothetical protein
LTGGPQEIRGVAFGGLHGVRRVQVSADGGLTWRDAVLSPSSPYAWVHWTYQWRAPSVGAHTLVVRAEGRDGTAQPETASRAYPRGTAGLHTVVALVKTV